MEQRPGSLYTEGEYKHNNHVTPKVTVDIFILDSQENHIVLIKRMNPPHGWALPGGFVDCGETTMQAAVREALEETGCRLARVEQFHTYSDPSRDPRGHGITVAYIAYTLDRAVAADDAKEVGYFNLHTMQTHTAPNVYRAGFDIPAKTIVFDHMEMIIDLKHYLETGKRPTRE
jgi:8-oxo-dGTP diphosphatase